MLVLLTGCYKESDCFGFPDIISDDFGSCCAAGGTAYLDPLSEECTVCPGKCKNICICIHVHIYLLEYIYIRTHNVMYMYIHTCRHC